MNIIQPFSSKFESLRVKFSQEAYKKLGIEVFSTENVPFSARTSPALAQNLVKLLYTRLNNLKKSEELPGNGVHIYELGAGTGILAKRILDLLKKEYKSIYNKIIIHISDISAPTISQLRMLDVFAEHKNHVSFEIIDITRPRFNHKPFLIYFTNLIDALPCRQIQIVNGQIYEVQTQTSIKNGAQIIDTTTYPPKLLEEREITDLILSPDINRRFVLAPQILSILEEKTKNVPIAKITNIGNEERKDLKRLSIYQSRNKPFTFNYNYMARMTIQKLTQKLENGGFLFFSDFGITSREYEQDLLVAYGLVVAFPVDFPALKHAAEMINKTIYLTSNEQGHPQEMLIDTLPKSQQLKTLFNGLPSEDSETKINKFLENTKILLMKDPSLRQLRLKDVVNLYSSLPPKIKINYRLLNDFAFLLLQIGLYKEAIHWTDILFENYSYAVGIFYYLIKGKAEQELGNFKKAEAFFKEAIKRKKGFLAYGYLGDLYWLEKRYEECIKAVQNYLKYTRKGDHLQCLYLISLAQEQLFGRKTARKTLTKLIKLGQKIQKLSPSEYEFFYLAKIRQKRLN